MKKFMKKYQGFTLVELLVVIAIIGILSSIVVVSIGPVRANARDSARRSDMSQIFTAQELYNDVNFAYYATGTSDGIPAIGTYLAEMHDPSCRMVSGVWDCTGGSGVDYKWVAGGTATEYCAWAKMEQDTPECEAADSYWAVSHRGTKMICTTAPDAIAKCY